MKSWLGRKCYERILVHTDEHSIEGVLTGTARDGIVLEDAVLLPEQGGRVPLSGTTFVPRDRIRFVQTLTGVSSRDTIVS